MEKSLKLDEKTYEYVMNVFSIEAIVKSSGECNFYVEYITCMCDNILHTIAVKSR